MQLILIICHVVIAIALVALVLLQQGKGANMGAAFGSGASNTLFGSAGPASFLMKLTSFLALAFFVTSLTLGYLVATEARHANQLNIPSAPMQQQQGGSVPALPIPQ